MRKGTNFFRNPKIVHTFAPAPAGCGTTAPFIASHYAAASASVAGAFSLRTGCRLPASFWRRRYEQYLPPGCIYNIKHTKAMIKIGQYNILRVSRFVEFGLYLVSDEDDTAPRRAGSNVKVPAEVLLPSRYIPDNIAEGDTLRVFVYTDSEDRPVATTEHPYATAGEFAYLQVLEVNRVGAFMDWGLQGKQLLVPFSEQKVKMRPGGVYLVYVYLDTVTGRVVASARVERFLGNVFPDYRPYQRVHALVTGHNEIGYQTIVDNLHRGIIYSNEVYTPLEVEQTVTAYVKNIREDGKIDLTMTMPGTYNRVDHLGKTIMKLMESDSFPLTDHSTPEEIAEVLHCSKKDYKKAVGALFRDRRIARAEDGTWHAVK